MFFKEKKFSVKILRTVEIAPHRKGILIYVKGLGKLSYQLSRYPDDYWGDRFISNLMLNGVPLMQCDMSGCPTCASLLAAGYGIEKADCKELREISSQINAPFISLEDTIHKIEPLLGLLDTGLYLIEDILAYPTDGEGHFFWNLPNEWKEYTATGMIDVESGSLGGQPCYLYPTQSTDCFCEERVNFYREIYRQDSVSAPRAIVYGGIGEFMGLLLDGHHKACAAVLEQAPIPCVMILPYGGYSYKMEGKTPVIDKIWFSGVYLEKNQIPEQYLPKGKENNNMEMGEKKEFLSHLMNKEWPQEYLEGAKLYPTVEEYAVWISTGGKPFTNQQLEEYLEDLPHKGYEQAAAVLKYLSRRKDKRVIKPAIQCSKIKELQEHIFHALLEFKEDPEAEQFFIEYLVENEGSEHLKKLAASYWEDV